jgi:hypothetical protein
MHIHKLKEVTMPKYDVTKLNFGIDKLLAMTTNPRHRFLLQAYSRHRYLEVAGRHEEIFAPEMMPPSLCYHFHAGGMNAKLEGQDGVKSLYRMWAETNQSIFYVDALASARFSLRHDPKESPFQEECRGGRERDVSVFELPRDGLAPAMI